MMALSEVSCEQMLKAILVMLSSDTLFYYSSHVKHRTSYEEDKDALRSCYNKSYKRARILTNGHSLRLTEEFMKNCDESEIEVF